MGMWLASSSAGGVMGRSERRNVRERGALSTAPDQRRNQNPSLTLSVETSSDLAQRARGCRTANPYQLGVRGASARSRKRRLECLAHYQAHSPPLIDDRVALTCSKYLAPRSGRCITADRPPTLVNCDTYHDGPARGDRGAKVAQASARWLGADGCLGIRPTISAHAWDVSRSVIFLPYLVSQRSRPERVRGR